MTLYTRTGDRGETGLFDGTRVAKSDPRVVACGEVDELNALLGVARTQVTDADVAGMLAALQRDLFALGARLADPRRRMAGRIVKTELGDAAVQTLESWIDRLEEELPRLYRFILPGGSPAGARLHLARTVCRRAERQIVALGPDVVSAPVLIYINRLSDLLFVLARVVNLRAGASELEW